MNTKTLYGWCGTILAMLVAVAVPYTPALAESNTYFTPSVAFGRGYDDNLFFTSANEQADSFWRLSPAIGAGYESQVWSVGANYSVDAERYTDHKELNSNVARRNGDMNLSYQATERLQLGLYGNYISTNTPADISPATGIAIGRTRAKVYSLTPSVTYAYNPLTTVSAAYRDSRQVLEGGVDTELRSTRLRVARGLSASDTVFANFMNDLYDFGPAGSVTSRAFTLGWARDLTAKTSFSVAAGPRNTEGDITAELSASLRHAIDRGAISVDYLRTQTDVLGETAPVDAHIFRVLFDYSLNPAIDIQVSPSVVRNSIGTSDADIYRLNLHARYKMGEMLSLIGSYQYNKQKGVLGGASNVQISENVIYVGVSFAFHQPQEGVFRNRQGSPFDPLAPAQRQ